ncbi:MAG: hypothetical protein V1736_13910 [Pseudomonadota bacterium]
MRPQPIPKLLRDPVPEAFGGQHLHIRHPGQHPADQFLAPGRLQPHLDAAVVARPELLGRVPLPLSDVDGQFRLEDEPDLQGISPPVMPKACRAYLSASKSTGRENVWPEVSIRPNCGREMRIVALINERDVIECILRHLGLREPWVRVVTTRDPPFEEFVETVIEDWLDDDPFPDYEQEPVTMVL